MNSGGKPGSLSVATAGGTDTHEVTLSSLDIAVCVMKCSHLILKNISAILMVPP